MTLLFETGPVIDRHIEGIIKFMLSKLSNNNPRKDSKCYMKAVQTINEIYTGNFLNNKHFDNSKDGMFDMTDVFQKINECKNDWTKVRDIIMNSLLHLEEAKRPEKMPWNKSYLNSITFSRFFDSGYNQEGYTDCPFLHLINPPKDSYAYTSDITINKLKENTSGMLKPSAEKFCKKYFRIKSYQLSFWYCMEDWTRWLRLLKRNYAEVYADFIASCEDANPFEDFKNYLMNTLKQKEGEHPVVNHWYFRLAFNNEPELSGYFKQWLRNGIDKGKFSIFRRLPKSIDKYYTDESFMNSKVKTEKKKEVIELEDIIF